MTKHQFLAIFAAALLGAFWVYPNVSKTPRQSRGPASLPQATAPVAQQPAPQQIQRKQVHIKPMKVAVKKINKKAKLAKSSLAKRNRINFENADRRPTSLPAKKVRNKRDNLA